MREVLSFLLAASLALVAGVNYTYDAAGRLIKVDYGHGSIINYTCDKAGSAANGDNLFSCTYGGSATPAGALITVQQ
jgi:hypothetical protein